MIPNEEINLIRNKSNIVDIISSYINLEPKGKNYFGICPFHDDHNPSMSVSPDKQIYTCFVCGATGNVFKFVQDYENISFPEAVKKVGEKIGHNVNYTKSNDNKPNKKYYDILDLSSKYYINNLNTKEGIIAKEYLYKRNINDELINLFNIGVAFNDNNLSKLLINKGFEEKDLLEVGISNKDDNLYDLFRGRIIFPISDENGKTVAFSGRIYNKEDISKYINSKESIIFKKSNILYNYNIAKTEARKKKEIFVVEGFMDVIRMYSIGIKNVVATMGTAFTDDYARLLKKLSVKITLIMDSDEPGIKSATQAGDILLKHNLNSNVVILSGEKDPDDYIVKHGEDKFKELLNNSISLFDFKLLNFRKDKDLNKSNELSNYVTLVIKELNKIDDDILKEVTINNLNKEFGLDKEILYSKITKTEKIKPKPVIIKKKPKLSKNNRIAEAVLYMMMKDIKYIRKYENDLGYIPNPSYDQIANDIMAYYKTSKDFNIADFISYEVKSKYYDLVLSIINNYEQKEPIYEEFNNYIEYIHKWIKEEQINSLMKQLKDEPDINKKQELNDLIIKLKRESDIDG